MTSKKEDKRSFDKPILCPNCCEPVSHSWDHQDWTYRRYDCERKEDF